MEWVQRPPLLLKMSKRKPPKNYPKTFGFGLNPPPPFWKMSQSKRFFCMSSLSVAHSSSSSSSSSSSRTTLPLFYYRMNSLNNNVWFILFVRQWLKAPPISRIVFHPPSFSWSSNNKDLQWKVGCYSLLLERLVPPSPCRARPLPQVKGKFPTVQSQGPDQDGASTCWPAKGINFCMTNVLAGTILQWLNYDDFIFGKDFDKAIYQQWLFLHGIAKLKLFKH